MHISSTVNPGMLGLLLLVTAGTFAAPADETKLVPVTAELVRRGDGSSRRQAIDVSVDVAGWPDIAEEDCYCILCLEGAELSYKRIETAGEKKTNYQDSKANTQPFQAQNLEQRKTKQINGGTTSAEECLFESLHHPNQPAFVFPATPAQQQKQAGSLSGAYAKSGAGYGKWVKFGFHNSQGELGPWCKALFNTPPNTDICDPKKAPKETLFGTSNVSIPQYGFELIPGQKAPYQFQPASPKK